MCRQFDDEGRAGAGFAFRANGPAVFVNDAVGKTEAEARALAGFFRGEERIENPFQIFFGDAGAVVGNGDAHAAMIRFGAHAKFAFALVTVHCLPRIVHEIQEHLLNLMRIDEHRRQIRFELRDDFDVTGAHLVSQNLDHRFDEFVEVGDFAFRLMLAREAEQALHDLLARRALPAMRSTKRFCRSSTLVCCNNSEKPSNDVSGLFNSWVTPATNSPMAESFSLWMSCACVFSRRVTVCSSFSRAAWRFSVM